MSSFAAESARVASPTPDRLARRRATTRLADRIATGAMWTLAIAIVTLLVYIIGYSVIQGLGVLNLKFGR